MQYFQIKIRYKLVYFFQLINSIKTTKNYNKFQGAERTDKCIYHFKKNMQNFIFFEIESFLIDNLDLKNNKKNVN